MPPNDEIEGQLESLDLSRDEHVQLTTDGDANKGLFNHKMTIVALALANFCIAAGVSLQGPFFPKEAELKGASATVYGMIFGIYELTMLATSFIFGRLVAKLAPNLFCCWGLLTVGLSTAVFGLIDHLPRGLPFIIPAFVLRVIEALGATAFATCSYSFVTEAFADRVATVFSIMETFFGIGMIVGPAIGGALYEFGGYATPFVVLGIFLVASSAVAFILLPKTSVNRQSGQEQISVWQFLSSPIIIIDSLVLISALNLIGFNSATLEPHLRRFQLSHMVTGFVFVSTGLMYAICAPIWGRICDIADFLAPMTSLIGTVLCIFGLALIGPLPGFGFEPRLWLVVFCLLLFGVGTAAMQVGGFTDALRYSVAVRRLPDDASTHGLVSAMFFACVSTGGFVGPTSGGALLQYFGYSFASAVMFIFQTFVLLAVVVGIFVRQHN